MKPAPEAGIVKFIFIFEGHTPLNNLTKRSLALKRTSCLERSSFPRLSDASCFIFILISFISSSFFSASDCSQRRRTHWYTDQTTVDTCTKRLLIHVPNDCWYMDQTSVDTRTKRLTIDTRTKQLLIHGPTDCSYTDKTTIDTRTKRLFIHGPNDYWYTDQTTVHTWTKRLFIHGPNDCW